MTRRRAELGTIETGDLGKLVRTKISEDIIESARAKRVGDQVVIESNALKNKDDDSIKFYERGSISATKVSEGASIEDNAQSEPSYSAVMTAQADKYAVYDAVTREAIEDARVDVVDGVTEEMGEALAQKKDTLILERLCNDTSTTEWLAGGEGTLSNTPVISATVTASEDTVGSSDFCPATGTVISDTTSEITVAYSFVGGNVGTQNSSSQDELSLSDVSNTKFNVTTAKYTPDKLVVSPRFITYLEGNSNFINAHTYTGELPQNVEGRLYNMDVLVSDNLPNERIAIIVDSDKAMPYLQKTDLDLERKDDKNEQVMKLYASERYAVGGNSEGSRLLRDKAVSVLAIKHSVSL